MMSTLSPPPGPFSRLFLSLTIVSLVVAAPSLPRVHLLTPDDKVIDGGERAIRPGDLIHLQAGDYSHLVFRNVQGQASAPVTITNEPGGRVRIGNPNTQFAVHFSGSTHFAFRGNGDPSIAYGIEIHAARSKGGVGVQVNDFSSHFELSHLEIHHVGFAGIMAKTDPRCDGSVVRDEFVQRDTHIHHNHIHDLGGEGLYIGHSFYSGWSHDCDGHPDTAPVIHYPHALEGVRIHHNLIERTGWDGLQVGSATQDCEITANTIADTGLRGVRYQQNGIQIGEGTTGLCAHNHITAAGAHGIILLGRGDNRIIENTIIRPGAYGLFGDNRPDTEPGHPVLISGNTIVAPGRGAFFIMNEISTVTLDQNHLTQAADLPELTLGDGARPVWIPNPIDQ